MSPDDVPAGHHWSARSGQRVLDATQPAASLRPHRGNVAGDAWRRIRSLMAWPDVRALVGIFLAAQALDGLTTWLALQTGRFDEGNPWLDEAVAAHPLLTYATKFGIALVIVVALLLVRFRWRLRNWVLAAFALLSVAAPAGNALRIAGWLP
jgi:hypothetical protein